MEDILQKWKYSSQWPSVMCHSSLDRYLPGDKEYGEFDRGFETVRGAASAPRFQTALRAFRACFPGRFHPCPAAPRAYLKNKPTPSQIGRSSEELGVLRPGSQGLWEGHVCGETRTQLPLGDTHSHGGYLVG